MIFLSVASASLFDDATASTLGSTAEWSNKVRMSDIDGDGDLDILFANGGNYASPGSPEVNRVFVNDTGTFTPLELPGGPDLTRSLAVADLDADGFPDIVVSGAYQTQSRLFLGSSSGFVSSTSLPQTPHSFGDIELGDVDGDGDLDAVLADWGPGDPLGNGGGRTRLWLNEGGVFTDVTESQMPDLSVGMSWDLTLSDVDGDFDLDALVSSKGDATSHLFLNDGSGTFVDASDRIPSRTNNYTFAAMDIDADGDVDLMTINDGNDLRERVLLNDGSGTFVASNATWLPPRANIGEDDNAIVFLDADDDGDPDALIGSLSGPDRLLVNRGDHFELSQDPVFDGTHTDGTLGIALGDLDGDGRLDAVMAQGEVSDDDRLYFGDTVAMDSHPPVVTLGLEGSSPFRVRVHDRMTPVRPSDLTVVLRTASGDTPFTHAGGMLFQLPSSPDSGSVCASDRSGNERCVSLDSTPASPLPSTPTTASPLSPEPPPTDEGGCAHAPSRWAGLGLLLLLAGLGRRRRG